MLLLALVAAAHAASPDARATAAVTDWLERCPAVAARARFHKGSDAARVRVGAASVLRIETTNYGNDTGRFSELTRTTTWMLGRDCRAVGLVELGNPSVHGSGGGTVRAGFVAADGAVPTAAEQETLLAWAGKLDWDPARPEHAVATEAFTPRGPGALPGEAPGEGLEGTLYRAPARTWRAGPVPAQQEAWRRGEVAPDGATCPCWAVYSPGGPGNVWQGAWVAHVFIGVAGPMVTLLEDREDVRWAVEAKPPFFVGAGGARLLAGEPPAALAAVRSAWWSGPAPGGSTFAVVDPASGAWFLIEVASPGPVTWTPTGVAFGTVRRLSAETMLGWLGP